MKDISKISVSVIVTTYNSPGALRRVLEGLSLQSRLPDEVIVADDGSGPETAELIADFAKEAAFPVRHVWQEDTGFRAARIRNKAVKEARRDYIVFMDGDCVPNRHYVAGHLALSEQGCVVQGKRVLLDEEASGRFAPEHANSMGALLREFLRGHLGNAHHLLRIPLFPASRGTGMRGIKTCSFGVFRSDVMAVNGFNEDFTGWGREDSDFAARLFKYGLRRKEHLFSAICFHLWHPGQPRESLSKNEALLAATLSGEEYRCKRGIVGEGQE